MDAAQLELFFADVLDPESKSDQHSLEHPFFSLSKTPDREPRVYEHKGAKLMVTPSVLGHMTIFDKDILIYAISQLREGMNRGRPDAVNRRIRITAYQLQKAASRSIGGKGYKDLMDSLTRLRGTTIHTNIKAGQRRQVAGFSLIDTFKIDSVKRMNKKTGEEQQVMESIEVGLSEWLYDAVASGTELLTISREYYQVTSGLKRRIYEICRKHCGSQPSWAIDLETLHKKSGSRSILRRFRFEVRKLADKADLLDYIIRFDDEKDRLICYSKKHPEALSHLLPGA